MYADNHDGRLVPNWNWENNRTDPEKFPAWVRGVMSFEDDNPDNTNTVYLTEGLLGRYHGSSGIYKCPSDKSVAKVGGRIQPRVRTVSMNSHMGMPGFGEEPGRYFLKASDIIDPAPSQALVFIVQREDAIEDAWHRIDLANRGQVQYPEAYHNNSGNLSFADGHVETKKWTDPFTTPPLVRDGYLFDRFPRWRTGENPDIEWIRERATSRINISREN